MEPSVLLLDEPHSARDLKLRQHMRADLRASQRRTGVTLIDITRDQGEALTMFGPIAVMNKGVTEQIGTGDAICSAPATALAVSFVGEANRLDGRVETAVHVTNTGRTELPGDHATLSFATDPAVILPASPLARTGRELAAQ